MTDAAHNLARVGRIPTLCIRRPEKKNAFTPAMWQRLGYVDTAGQLPEEHAAYDVGCTADGHYVVLKGGVGGYMQTRYELIELQR